MNSFTFDDIPLGGTESFTVSVTENMMSDFFDITGDSNPLHTDENYAKEKGYKGKVVYGMLTASFLSTLAGVYLPGENSLIHLVEAEFPAPVFIGDTLKITGTVSRKDDNFKTIEIKVVAVNDNWQKVLRGKMRVGVRQ
jgi:3-hydroxybutyryl-CoA dehydratase